jgi:hypothetical protein
LLPPSNLKILENPASMIVDSADIVILRSLDHTYRSFKGFNCLMIFTVIWSESNRREDILVDSLSFRQYLQR